MTKFESSFGDRLRDLRKAANLSQRDLSELINWSDSLVGLWERGLAYPNPYQMELLRSVLGDLDG